MVPFSVTLKRRARSTPSGSSGKDASGTADLTRAYAGQRRHRPAHLGLSRWIGLARQTPSTAAQGAKGDAGFCAPAEHPQARSIVSLSEQEARESRDRESRRRAAGVRGT
jgi:hypothetical protein